MNYSKTSEECMKYLDKIKLEDDIKNETGTAQSSTMKVKGKKKKKK